MSKTKALPKKIISFLTKQGYVIVSSVDPQGKIHSSAKGVVGIEEQGKVFLIDLFHARTYNNLKN